MAKAILKTSPSRLGEKILIISYNDMRPIDQHKTAVLDLIPQADPDLDLQGSSPMGYMGDLMLYLDVGIKFGTNLS